MTTRGDAALVAAVQPMAEGAKAPGVLDAIQATSEVVRSFVFVDLCDFTAFTDRRGPHAAGRALTLFRALVRDISDRRGVRVAKWMGDGAMLVGVDPAPSVALAVDVIGRIDDEELGACAGVATGPVLLFDGGDYVGRYVNMASRLCDMAAPGEVLAEGRSVAHVPPWVMVSPYRTVSIRGIGRVDTIRRLHASPGLFTTSVRLTAP
jgi:adenylate cyclase